MRGILLSRSADYTIQGFIYQFNKTLLEILNSDEDSEICIEGIIEDIDIISGGSTKAIQCKYHESQETFQLSLIYKPLLQMMNHYLENSSKNIEYKLFAFFPNETPQTSYDITNQQIEQVLQSQNQIYEKLIKKIKGKINIEEFLSRFSLEFGDSLSMLTEKVMHSLNENDLELEDIETLYYPNAIQKIADLSIQHSVDDRKINKLVLISHLKQVKKTAITRWTRSLNTLEKLLRKRKTQLKSNLDKNSRLRYFVLSEPLLKEFNDQIVNFISDYLTKYHFKEVHDKTPLFCLECSDEIFHDIRVRLYKKSIQFNDGLITDYHFDKQRFLKDPFRIKQGKVFYREYDLKLIRLNVDEIEIFNQNKPDDYFLFINEKPQLDYQDTNVEHIILQDFKQIKYILGLGDTYE